MVADILIVDDEADIRELISGILQDEGHETRLAHNSDSALAEIDARRPSLIVLDIWLQGSKLDGLELLQIIKERHPDVPVVIISGHGNIETAVAAIKRAYRTLYREGLSLEDAKAALQSQATGTPEIARLVEFLGASTRGIVR